MISVKPKVDLKHEYVVKEGDDVELVCSYHGEGHVTAKFVSGHSEFAVRNEAVSAGNSEEIRPESNESEEVTTTSENSEETSTQDEVELKSAENVNDEEDHTSQQDDGEQDEQEESKKWKRVSAKSKNSKIENMTGNLDWQKFRVSKFGRFILGFAILYSGIITC